MSINKAAMRLALPQSEKHFLVLLGTFTNKRNQTYYSPAYEAGVLSIDYIGGWKKQNRTSHR